MPPCRSKAGREDHSDPADADAAAPRPAVLRGRDSLPRRHFDATLVRVETDEGITGYGSGDTMDGFEPFESLFTGHDPLSIAEPRQDDRVGRLSRRPVLAARGRAVGHRRPGDRAAGQRPVRRGLPTAARLRLVRRGEEPASPGAGGGGGKGSRLSGHENTDIPNGLGVKPRSRACHPGGRRRGRRHHGRPQPVVADGRRPLARAR